MNKAEGKGVQGHDSDVDARQDGRPGGGPAVSAANKVGQVTKNPVW